MIKSNLSKEKVWDSTRMSVRVKWGLAKEKRGLGVIRSVSREMQGGCDKESQM